MTLTSSSTLRQVVGTVSAVLQAHGIRAVLTGGACASLHARGEYLSQDLDYIIEGRVTQSALEAALATIGFARHGESFRHPRTPFFVEFPRGPLAIGDDDLVEPVVTRVGRTSVLSLSPTDSCRDRLAAFYHWNDRQSLDVAVKIARHHRVRLVTIREWSLGEGHGPKYQEFAAAVASPQARGREHGS